jgi:hypothetical protein
MKYKGVEYKVLQTTSRDVWAWSFEPPKAVPIQGKTKGGRHAAVATVQRAIDKWLKSDADDAPD